MFDDGKYIVCLYSGGECVERFTAEVVNEPRGSIGEPYPTKQLILWQNCISLYDMDAKTRKVLHGTFTLTKTE